MSILDGDTRGHDCRHAKIRCNRRTTQSARVKGKSMGVFSLQRVMELLEEKVILSDRQIQGKGKLGIPQRPGQVKVEREEKEVTFE